jgi:hypothetical protein
VYVQLCTDVEFNQEQVGPVVKKALHTGLLQFSGPLASLFAES